MKLRPHTTIFVYECNNHLPSFPRSKKVKSEKKNLRSMQYGNIVQHSGLVKCSFKSQQCAFFSFLYFKQKNSKQRWSFDKSSQEHSCLINSKLIQLDENLQPYRRLLNSVTCWFLLPVKLVNNFEMLFSSIIAQFDAYSII